MASACALAIISGKIILYFVIPERLRTLRDDIFTRRGRGEKRQLQRRFLRKRGAAGSNLALSVCSLRSHPPLPTGEALAKPQALRFDWKLCRYAKGSPFEERLPPFRGKMSRSDKRGNLAR